MSMRNIIDIVEGKNSQVYRIPVKPLSKIYNAFKSVPWVGCHPIAQSDVQKALDAGKTTDHSFDTLGAMSQNRLTDDSEKVTNFHIRRIAHLVRHPDGKPIDIIPNIHGSFDLDDGHHRLAAAIYRGDTHIPVNFGGTRDQMKIWLGIR